MASIDEIRDVRLNKLEILKKNGIDPYPAKSFREISLKEASDSFISLEKEKEKKMDCR